MIIVKGIYLLITKLDKEKTIKIGKLDRIEFKPGYYVYVGSGMNNVVKRVQRHYSANKKIYWHIDYFLQHANIICTKIFKSSDECGLATLVKKSSDSSIDSFGCSDCKCGSHLYYFNENPTKNLEKINI